MSFMFPTSLYRCTFQALPFGGSRSNIDPRRFAVLPTTSNSLRILKFATQRNLRCFADLEKNTNNLNEEKLEDVVATRTTTRNDATRMTQSEKKSARKEKSVAANEYPTEEESDEVNFFPVRDPGNFPSVGLFSKDLTIAEEIKKQEFDPLRDGPLRYLGYANELGEAFAAWLPPGGIPLSYAVSVSYVLVDTGDKGLKAAKQAGEELESITNLNPTVATKKLTSLLAGERAIDTVVWQLLASVIIPGFTIHMVVAFVHFLLLSVLHINEPTMLLPALSSGLDGLASTVGTNRDTVVELVEKSVPTFCGLATIPFIVHPIDSTVHAMLNVSMRPAMRQFLCDGGQGKLAGLKICDEECLVNDFPILDESTNLIDAFAKSFEEEEF